MKSNFQQRKKEILSKKDKSVIGKWDKKIIKLCNKINKKKQYYTTSSCSGRIVLILDKKDRNNVFQYVSHDLITFEKLKQVLSKVKGKGIKFKQEPPILHVACEGLQDAEKLLKKARFVGWKRSGIISSENKFICELISTEKLEFPIIEKGKILVNDNFLKLIVKKSNENMKTGWKKIEKFEKSIT